MTPGQLDALTADAVRRVAAVATALPEAYEEDAWVGVRWRIRQITFAHVVPIHDGRPSGHAGAAGTDGPALALTVRAGPEDMELYRRLGPPWFAPGWWRDMIGLLLGPDTDWEEVAELVTDSYCLRAPRRLAALVERPG